MTLTGAGVAPPLPRPGGELTASGTAEPVTHSAAATGRFPALDGVRALAALAVVLTHVGFSTGLSLRGGPVGVATARLDAGVTVFFVLSGFLLYRPWAAAHLGAGRSPAVRGYLWRRALRILPAYWLALTVTLLTIDRDQLRTPVDWLVQYGLAQIYLPARIYQGLAMVWSLCVEVSFYLALPLLAWLLGVRSRRRAPGAQARFELIALAALAAGSLGWSAAVTTGHFLDPRLAGLWLPGHLDWFAAGMALAVVQVRVTADRAAFPTLRMLGEAPWLCWALAAAALWLSTTPLCGPRLIDGFTAWQVATKHVLYVAAAGLLVAPCALAPHGSGWRPQALLTTGPLRFLGEISYGVFLWHLCLQQGIYAALGYPLFSGHFVVMLVAVLATTVLVSTLSYRWLEEPVLRLKRLVR
ncbi:MAG: acyltransferase family protein [Frankiaceae bacterium]